MSYDYNWPPRSRLGWVGFIVFIVIVSALLAVVFV